jgi:NifB/MoaA-like Fe-S oxidoreductase
MQPFSKEDAAKILAQVHAWQKKLKASYNTSFVFAADEFYLKAEIPVPDAAEYEDFPQIENGVGMIAHTQESFFERLSEITPFSANKTISIATGKAGYDLMRALSDRLTEIAKGLKINVYCIENQFFGEYITVSGLLTGQDILNQLAGQPLGDALFIPENALRSGETVFLDDITVADIAEKLGVPVLPLRADGAELIDCMINITE